MPEFAQKKPQSQRVPPHHDEAEQSVLGSMLLNSGCVDEAVMSLKPDDFYNPQNRDIFGVMVKLTDRGMPIDIVTVADMMERDGLMHISTYEYLSRLAGAAKTCGFCMSSGHTAIAKPFSTLAFSTI